MVGLGLRVGIGHRRRRAAGGGGGDGTPAWVEALRSPAGDLPYMASDFRNGRYWDNGAEVALGDIWIENLDWTTWDPAAIVPGSGLGDTPVSGPLYTGDIAALFPTGATVLVEIFMPAEPSSAYNEFSFLDPATYDEEVYFYVVGGTPDVLGGGHGGGPYQYDLEGNSWSKSWGGWFDGVFRFAGTTGASTGAFSTMGRPTVASDNGGVTYDLSVLPSFGVGSCDTGRFVRLVALYAPQPDADLPEMSAVSGGAATYQGLAITSFDNGSPPDGSSYLLTWLGGTYPYTVASIGAPLPDGVTLVAAETPESSPGRLVISGATPGEYPGLQFRVTDTLGATADSEPATLTIFE